MIVGRKLLLALRPLTVDDNPRHHERRGGPPTLVGASWHRRYGVDTTMYPSRSRVVCQAPYCGGAGVRGDRAVCRRSRMTCTSGV